MYTNQLSIHPKDIGSSRANVYFIPPNELTELHRNTI